jgi:hypothetical protein
MYMYNIDLKGESQEIVFVESSVNPDFVGLLRTVIHLHLDFGLGISNLTLLMIYLRQCLHTMTIRSCEKVANEPYIQ